MRMAYADDLRPVIFDEQWLTLQAFHTMGWDECELPKMRYVTGMLYQDVKTTLVQNVLGADAVKMLQSRLRHVKFKEDSVFPSAPSRAIHILGVDITPTMNWALQVDTQDNVQKLGNNMLI